MRRVAGGGYLDGGGVGAFEDVEAAVGEVNFNKRPVHGRSHADAVDRRQPFQTARQSHHALRRPLGGPGGGGLLGRRG